MAESNEKMALRASLESGTTKSHRTGVFGMDLGPLLKFKEVN